MAMVVEMLGLACNERALGAVRHHLHLMNKGDHIQERISLFIHELIFCFCSICILCFVRHLMTLWITLLRNELSKFDVLTFNAKSQGWSGAGVGVGMLRGVGTT